MEAEIADVDTWSKRRVEGYCSRSNKRKSARLLTLRQHRQMHCTIEELSVQNISQSENFTMTVISAALGEVKLKITAPIVALCNTTGTNARPAEPNNRSRACSLKPREVFIWITLLHHLFYSSPVIASPSGSRFSCAENLPKIEHANVLPQTNNSYARYACLQGFRMIDPLTMEPSSGVLECSNNDEWFPKPYPECRADEPVRTPEIHSEAAAEYDGKSSYACECPHEKLEGISVSEVVPSVHPKERGLHLRSSVALFCPPPPIIPNARNFTDSSEPNAQFYICDKGFVMYDPKNKSFAYGKLTCVGGVWSPYPFPGCWRIEKVTIIKSNEIDAQAQITQSCPPTPIIPNAPNFASSSEPNAKFYIYDEGYVMYDTKNKTYSSGNLTCVDGVWSPYPLPGCWRIEKVTSIKSNGSNGENCASGNFSGLWSGLIFFIGIAIGVAIGVAIGITRQPQGDQESNGKLIPTRQENICVSSIPAHRCCCF